MECFTRKYGVLYSVFKVRARYARPPRACPMRFSLSPLRLWYYHIKKRQSTIFTILAESFFSFYRAGRFGRHTEPVLYSIQRGNGFRHKSRGSFHPAHPWYIFLTKSKFQSQNLKFLTHLWYNINMGRWCTPIPTLSKGGELLNNGGHKSKTQT